MKYHFPNLVEDDYEVSPNVARILDAMLKKINPSNSVLVANLKNVNPFVETRILFPGSDKGSSKKSKRSKNMTEDVLVNVSPKKIVSKTPKKSGIDKEKVLKITDKPKEKIATESSK